MDSRLRNLDERLKVIERDREGELTLLRREIRKNKDRLNKLHGTCGSPDAEGCDESSNQQGGKRRKTRRKRRKRRKRTFKKRKSRKRIRKRIRKKKRSTRKH